MRDGKCPKCGAEDIRHGARLKACRYVPPVGHNYNYGRFEYAYDCRDMGRDVFLALICARCGYKEMYVLDSADLASISRDWPTWRPEG